MVSTQPGLDTSAQAPLFVNGMPVEAVGNALADSDSSTRGSHTDYWGSPERPAKSNVQEILEVGLSVERLVNKIDLLVSRYPCAVHVQFMSVDNSVWEPMRDQKTGKPIEARITDSVPSKIAGSVFIPAGSNISPQHAFPNHWESLSFRTDPTSCKKIRIVLQRIANKNAPVNANGRLVDYSVAVMDLDIGYKVESAQDLPATSTGGTHIDIKQPPSASNQDTLGSSVDYYIRDYFAADLNWNALQAQAGVNSEDRDSFNAWRCNPQPRSDAVVPFYVDVRDETGEGRVVDSFLVDPLTSGVSFNLYYSNSDQVVGRFAATDEVVRYPGLSESGNVVVSLEGLRFETSNDYLSIDNAQVQWDPRLPWWVALQFQPQFASTDTTPTVIFDSPALAVSWNGTGWEVRINGDHFVLPVETFLFSQKMIMIIGCNGNAGEVRFFDKVTQVIVNTTVEPGSIRIGAGFSSVAGDVRVDRLVIKQEALDESNGQPTDRKMQAYTGVGRWIKSGVTGPTSETFSVESTETGARFTIRPETDNALLRIDPAFQGRDVSNSAVFSNQNPFGVRGGPGHFYEKVSWTPVPREFRLYKGVLRFDPVKAKYFKFEFTNLVPKPYSVPESVIRSVFTFPVVPDPHHSGDHHGIETGARVNQDLGNGIRFSDQRGVRIRQTKGYQDYKPTEALFTRDSEATSRLRNLAPVFGLEPWHQDASIPRFAKDQPHVYTKTFVAHDTKVAYYVGLRQLRAMRSNHGAPIDTDEYLFAFLDDNMLVQDLSNPWSLDPGEGLHTPPGTAVTAQVTSEPLRSRRNVRGVQFAATQTPPVQRLTDSDFNDASMSRWEAYGGAQIDRLEDTTSDFGTTIRVRRQPEGAYWNFVEDRYDTWNDIENLDPDPLKPTWDDITFLGTVVLSTGGIEGTEYVTMPSRGRIYAAARVYAPTPLTAPLHVQIIGDDGEVLADQKTDSFQGQVIEWYASFTVGEGGEPPEFNSWDEVEAFGDWDDVEAEGDWTTLEGFGPATVFNGKVSTRVFQEGATTDVFYVDNVSIFEDPIIWEFSNDGGTHWYPAYDIRNNPDGVLIFPATDAEVIDQQQGTELLWRVSGYRSDLHVSSLAIRPWYYGPGMGIMPHGSLEQAGPNRSPYDQFPAVQDSPRFKAWNKPIPQSWWYVYRQWLMQQIQPVANVPIEFGNVLSDALYTDEES